MHFLSTGDIQGGKCSDVISMQMHRSIGCEYMCLQTTVLASACVSERMFDKTDEREGV